MRFDIAECPQVPWKNGGGMTRMLAARDEGDKTLWRLSLADIQRDGPFSTFPGLQRVLTIVAGDGIDLSSKDGTLMARPWQPLPFAGDLELDSTLVGAESQAFNLMFDGARLNAQVSPLIGGGADLPDATNVIFCGKGQVSVSGEDDLTDGQGMVLKGAAKVKADGDTVSLVISLTVKQT